VITGEKTMKNTTVLSVVIAILVTASAISCAAEQPSGASQRLALTNSFDVYILRLKQLSQQDAQGLNTFQSDRAGELQKCCSSTEATNKTPSMLSAKAHELLSSLKSPVDTSRTVVPLLENKPLCRQLIDEQVVPVWTGTDWIDSRFLAFNGFAPPDKVQKRIMELNYWEQNFGVHSAPERAKEPFSGRNTGKIDGLRLAIINDGFLVKYDRTFGIWRITGTNAPAARAQ
jgi:hypothetical protein